MTNPLESDNLYQQQTELELLTALIPHIEEKTFLDIGAEKGGFTGFMRNHGFSGHLFEPYPGHRKALETLVANSGNRFHPLAIDNEDRVGTMHIAVGEQGEELDYYHSLIQMQDDPRVHHKNKIEVECRSLASLLDAGVIDRRVGIIKTDTEGNDLNVILGMGEVSAAILMCEYFTEGVYSGWHDAHPEKLIEAAADVPAGIAVLTDSDDTKSSAQGDYASFRACRH